MSCLTRHTPNLIRAGDIMNFADFYKQSIDDPQAFWADEAKLIDWN